MAVYKYTLIKYLKSYSTWIILFITLGIDFIFGGYFTSRAFGKRTQDADTYLIVAVFILLFLTTFLSTFMTIFVGFKAATMFKDEVEDGSFLIMISKTTTRSKLILYKWLALQTLLIAYAFIVSVGLILFFSLFDKSNPEELNFSTFGISTIESKSFYILLWIWLILFIMELIFSSITLILTTFFSVKSSIGIAVALGVIIPATQMIYLFSAKPEYFKMGRTINQSSPDLLNELYEKDPQIFSSTNKKYIENVFTKDFLPISNIGSDTGDIDSFQNLWPLDINYQINQMGRFAGNEIATPDKQIDVSEASHNDTLAKSIKNYRLTVSEDNPYTNPTQINDRVIEFENQINILWNNLSKVRTILINYNLNWLQSHATLKGSYSPIGIQEVFYERIATTLGKPLNYYTTINQTIFNELIQNANTLINDNDPSKKVLGLLLVEKIVKMPIEKESYFEMQFDKKDVIQSKNKYHSLANSTEESITPLSWTINEGVLKKQINLKGYSSRVYDSAIGSTIALQLLGKQGDVNSNHEYSLVRSYIESGGELYEMDVSGYVKKEGIIIFYGVIALFIVPLSLLLIRRKDYR